MSYKGHQNHLKLGEKYSKVVISSNDGESNFILKEYHFKNGKIYKIIDRINWVMSEYEYSGENFIVSFYNFEDDLEKKTLNSIKEIKTSHGLEIEELLFEFDGENKELIYECKKEYSNKKLVFETYAYPEVDYQILHDWNKNKSIETITYPNSGSKYENKFDSNGYLVECLNFQYEGMCEKTSYEYHNGTLLRVIEFPHMEFENPLSEQGISFKGLPEFINETTYYYNSNGLIEKTVKKEVNSGDITDITFYEYEK